MYKTLAEYTALFKRVKAQNSQDKQKLTRHLAKTDLFYLLTAVFGRIDAFRQWILDRCNEVNKEPNGYIDLWGRGHYKSTLIAYTLTIQSILRDPEITAVLISFNNDLAKAALIQIKREFEENIILQSVFSDILYEQPKRDSPKWTEDALIVKRKNNPKESTLEAYGLIDNQPIGRHYKLLIYDDIIAPKLVTPIMLPKVISSYQESTALRNVDGSSVVRIIGTRYHSSDPYGHIIKNNLAKVRLHPATSDGTADFSKSVFMLPAVLEDWYNTMGSWIFAAQMLQNPVAAGNAAFDRKDLEFYQIRPDKLKEFSRRMTIYIMVDGASTKNKHSDYTVMTVIGCNDDNNYYLLDMIRDKLNLSERCQKLFSLVKKWKPLKTGYEKNSREADIDYIKEKQEELNYRFPIVEIYTKLNKQDKIISALQPIFEDHRFYLPLELTYINYENKKVDLIEQFIDEEFVFYPFSMHDDILDCISMMIKCIKHTFPLQREEEGFNVRREQYHVQEYNSITGEPL